MWHYYLFEDEIVNAKIASNDFKILLYEYMLPTPAWNDSYHFSRWSTIIESIKDKSCFIHLLCLHSEDNYLFSILLKLSHIYQSQIISLMLEENFLLTSFSLHPLEIRIRIVNKRNRNVLMRVPFELKPTLVILSF